MFDNVTTDMPTDITTAAGITTTVTTIDITTTNGPITSSGMTTITLPTDMPTTDPPTIESTTCKYVCQHTVSDSIYVTLLINCSYEHYM